MQDWIVARQLYGTPGIAEVNSFGGELKQYEVAVNPNRLKAMGVSVTDIFTALEKTTKIQAVHTLIRNRMLISSEVSVWLLH
jgi:cobalt-zinc-cadmium resistance protein CzcA